MQGIKYSILTFLLSLYYSSLFGQSNDTWTAFWNSDSTLFGFKDKNAVIKIEPKFKAFSIPSKFENIIVITEVVNDFLESYYLTKSGRVVGRDSLYIFDNGPDCESEGFIRFRDPKTDKVGLFNKNGDIAIPAKYNNLTRVKNGMIVALKGAKKKYWEGGEHYSWIGGKELLIDTSNNVLINNFKYDNYINFFSLQVSKKPNPDSIRQSFKAINGKYFSFVVFEKEFMTWLKSSLLKNLTKENLLDATYKNLSFWKEPNGWTTEIKSSFIDKNFDLIKTKLLQLNSEDCNYDIFIEGLNPYIYESDDYKNFFNSCDEPKDWIYPIIRIVISYFKKNNLSNYEPKDLLQDHFEFLRTENGYKLISMTIRRGEIKLQ